MKVEQLIWDKKSGWKQVNGNDLKTTASIVFVFAPVILLKETARVNEIQKKYPTAELVFCSSQAAFIDDSVKEDAILISAIALEKTKIQTVHVDVSEVKDSFDAGAHISAQLEKEDLKGLILICAEFPTINPSHLLKGIHFNLSSQVPIIGGTASDLNFESIVGLNNTMSQGSVVAIGLSGEHILFGHGIDSAWTPFGSERFVTEVKDNVIFRLDKMTPYEFYRLYLEGLFDNVRDYVRHFPLGLKIDTLDRRIVRGVIDVDSATGAMAFAGDIPQGAKVRMLKSNVSQLIDSASYAAEQSKKCFNIDQPEFSLVFNCKGRRHILEEWAQEEIEAINKKLTVSGAMMGLYSSSEFAPLKPGTQTELQNQAVTITTLKEI